MSCDVILLIYISPMQPERMLLRDWFRHWQDSPWLVDKAWSHCDVTQCSISPGKAGVLQSPCNETAISPNFIKGCMDAGYMWCSRITCFYETEEMNCYYWYKLVDCLPLRSSHILLTSIWRSDCEWVTCPFWELVKKEKEKDVCVFGCAQSLVYYSWWMHT